jgi:hypothetical protein
MLFLPRNTSVEEIIDRCLFYSDAFTDHPDMLAIELEQLYYGDSCKVLLVSTGQLAKIQPSEVVSAFIDQFCASLNAKNSSHKSVSISSEKSEQDQKYLHQILVNLCKLKGYGYLAAAISRPPAKREPLFKVVK